MTYFHIAVRTKFLNRGGEQRITGDTSKTSSDRNKSYIRRRSWMRAIRPTVVMISTVMTLVPLGVLSNTLTRRVAKLTDNIHPPPNAAHVQKHKGSLVTRATTKAHPPFFALSKLFKKALPAKGKTSSMFRTSITPLEVRSRILKLRKIRSYKLTSR
jgi:hypothetical protein